MSISYNFLYNTVCEMESFGSVQGPVEGSCKHWNKTFDSIKGGAFLSSWATVSFMQTGFELRSDARLTALHCTARDAPSNTKTDTEQSAQCQ